MSDNDDFDLDDDLESQDTGAEQESSVIKRVRKAEREAAKRAKEADARVAELTAKLAEREAADRKAQLAGIATMLGLSAGQASLVPDGIEATKEAVAQWAVAHDLLRPEAAPAEAAPTSFVPVTGAGGVAPDLMISIEAFQAMYANPATQPDAIRLFQAGRVKGLQPGEDQPFRL